MTLPGRRHPIKTGSAASLLSWEDLGRQGRRFVSSGPTGAEIGAFFGQEALDPIRVYVGMNSADTADERAKLALEELKRTGAFDRSILIVVMPTGTGWVDPAALDPVEYLHRGDVASVAMQYSYLASWLSLLVEPDYGAEAGNALFREVYAYWSSLPRDGRPKLYLHGLSLGAMNSERSANLYDVDRRSVSGRPVERAALPEPHLAIRYRRPQSRIARMAPPLPRQLDLPVHQSERCLGHTGRDVGTDPDRLPSIRQRSDNLLRCRHALSRA